MLHKILAQRLDVVQHHELQTGFLRGKPISRNIFLLKDILKKAVDRRSSQYIAFLDFRKAFDSVNHSALYKVMRGVGLPASLVDYVRKVYNRSELFVGHRNTKQGKGVLQGDPLSPCLFNLMIDYILSKLNPDIGINYAGTSISALAYADDLILMASSRQGLEANLGTLARVVAGVGLSLGVGKCATIGRQ